MMGTMPNRLTVLTWHNVRSSWCFPFPGGRGPDLFARQLTVLSRVARVLPLETALADLYAGRPIGPRAVALTFDDGYADNLDVAVPLLRRHGLPATFFLVPGLLDKAATAWWEVLGWAFHHATTASVQWEEGVYELVDPAGRRRAYERVAEDLKRRDQATRLKDVARLVAALEPEGEAGDEAMFMDWDGARRLVGQGLAVGSHTTAHAILSEETPQAQREDLASSRARLQAELSVDVPLVAYPNGTVKDFSADTVAAASAAGYDAGLTTIEGLNRADTPPFEVRRHVVTPLTGTRYIASLGRQLGRQASRQLGWQVSQQLGRFSRGRL